jgi:hypothetical protein
MSAKPPPSIPPADCRLKPHHHRPHLTQRLARVPHHSGPQHRCPTDTRHCIIMDSTLGHRIPQMSQPRNRTRHSINPSQGQHQNHEPRQNVIAAPPNLGSHAKFQLQGVAKSDCQDSSSTSLFHCISNTTLITSRSSNITFLSLSPDA